MKQKLSWNRLNEFFEHGDLTPFAVLISVAHYGPVLAAHGDNVIIAWVVGILADLLHFRTVRKVFQVSGRRQILAHGLVALATTAMALGYHIRFYQGDWLLAAPIPFAIGVLALHTAERQQEERRDRIKVLFGRLRLVVTLARQMQTARDKALAERGELLSRIDTLMAERDTALAQADAAKTDLAKAKQQLGKNVVQLDKLPTRLADYVSTVASGTTPNGDFTARHGVGVSTLDRTNRMFLND